jgi:GAF domain-containing protein
MQSSFRKLFSPPVIDDPEKAGRARSIYIILLTTLALTFLFLLYAIFFPPPGQIIIALIAIACEFGLLVLITTKRILLVSTILTSMLWIAIVVEVALYGGIRDTGFGAFAAIIIIAGLTMGLRGSSIFAVLTLLAGIGLAYAESQSYLPPYPKVPIYSVLLSHSIDLIAVALLLNLAIHNIATVARKVLRDEKAEKEINAEFEAIQIDLQRRTAALEQRNTILQTVADVAKFTNQVRNEEELLDQSAKLLIEQIKLEHVSLFILDQMEEYAILQVSRSHSGKLLEIVNNKLTVVRSESTSLLLGADTIRLKIGNWNYYIDPPKKLPDMQTSLIFAIASADHLYGLMNIQIASSDSQAIDNQTMQMLANQIAISIANIRLLKELQNRIQEVNLLAGKNVTRAWEQLGEGGNIGYTYDRLQVIPADESFPPEVAAQLFEGKSVSFVSTGTPARARLAAPIILREAIIGAIGYDSNNFDHVWQDEEKALLETVASRVSLALENTRLVEEAEKRAEHERVISQITTRMRETLDIETILKTAVKEMRHSLNLREAEVRLQLAEESESIEVVNE